MEHLIKKLKRRIGLLTQTKKERRHTLVGPAHLWKMKRSFQIQFLKDMGLQHVHYLFDIGCGTLRGGIPLIDYLQVGHYFGLEVRSEVLDEGRKELKEAGLERKKPTLLVYPDISQLNLGRYFDYIWAFSVLIHMSDNILKDTFGFVNKHLSKEGFFYANVNIGKRKEHNWQGFPNVARTFDFYSDACTTNGLMISDLGPLRDLGHFSNVESQDNQRMLRITRKAENDF
jgi:cyclopropane fatty-acyl-phospholipid synthase-like methyltransferase